MNREQRRFIIQQQFVANFGHNCPEDVIEALCDYWEKSETAPSFVDPVCEQVVRKDPNNFALMKKVIHHVGRK